MAKLGDGHFTNILFELLATVFSSNLHSCPFNNIYRTSVWVSGLSQCLATESLCGGKRSMYSSLNHSSGKEKKKEGRDFLALLDLHMSLGNRHPCANCRAVC